MRNKKKAAAGAISQNLPHQSLPLLEGETLARFLKSFRSVIESSRAVDHTLPIKFWIKQQFAVGVNEVTRGLERMPPSISPDEQSGMNAADSEARSSCFQAILLASDCNPRSLTKHLTSLAASRNVPLITVKDRKEGSLRLGELIKVKTAIAIGVKAKGNSINQLLEETLTHHKIDSIEDEA